MGLIHKVEIRQLTSVKGGMAEFYTPQASHETMLVHVAPHTIDELYVHHFQTDQLLVVRGSFVLAVLQNRRYQYIALGEHYPAVVKIPAGVPHGAINLSEESCWLVNAVLRQGPTHAQDYRPMKPPLPYDITAAQAALAQLEMPLSA